MTQMVLSGLANLIIPRMRRTKIILPETTTAIRAPSVKAESALSLAAVKCGAKVGRGIGADVGLGTGLAEG